ncbi:unnamed protein product [Psylliodes chrysocephalus]|uniref:Arrestin C-terminal-like domain-containing protein n=1 Tax=Psylliodes chrysocephalus TaxID=3402493 RepID=A0A9P0D5Z5_9CUCU|nr:unnamed protein product [Psylliodes chrysocephala]
MACAIEVQHSGPFTPGSTITGKLLCFFKKAEYIKGIKCYLSGEEFTQFNVASHRNFHGVKTFLRREIEIMQPCTLQSGSYKYPFSFELPVRIPSSFEHEKGKVLYEITAEVYRGEERVYRCTHMIQVSVTVNLKDMVHEITMAPVTYPLEEILRSHCCCYSAHVFLALSLEKDAFLVGEDIKIKLNVNNAADVNISEVVLKLESHTEVTATEPQRRKFVAVDDICTKSESGVEGRSQKLYTLGLKIPADLNLPFLKQCKLIRQWYTITAVIKFNDCYDQVRLPGYVQLYHVSIDAPRPLGLPHPAEEDIRPKLNTSRNVIPVESDPSANRPPYPLGDSYFPSPHRNYMIPPKPDVHLPASYIIRPSAPPSLPSAPSALSPRRSPRNSPPPAETEALILRNDIEQPPTYYEAIHSINSSNE